MPPADQAADYAAHQAERVFLGDDAPAITLAADWLLQTLDAKRGTLGEALIVVPGSRAQRRLMELLVQGAAGRAMLPPTIVTLGGLADRLLPREGEPVANGLASLLCWASVLREAGDALIADILPSPPGRDDWPGWWALAEQAMQAADELGAQLMTIDSVAEQSLEHRDTARWSALAELSKRYEQTLVEHGLVDRHRARFDAIQSKACHWPGPVVLLATADLQPIHQRMLACLETPVTALIASASSHAEGFDAFGRLKATYWAGRPIAIDDDAVAFVDRPNDQAAAVLRALSAYAGREGLQPDRVTVGLGDESLASPIERTLDLANVPVRSSKGRLITASRPVQLLQALARFADGLGFDTLALLLRHPDAEETIAQATGEPTRSWLTLLDDYAEQHLAVRPNSGWLGDAGKVRAMDAVFQAARALLPDPPNSTRPLSDWADAIGHALEQVYSGRPLARHGEHDRPIVIALEAIGGVLERFQSLAAISQPHCTFAQAVSLLIRQLTGQPIPEPGGEPAVELIGYLELLLDDAPHLVLAGLNEQHVPAPPTHSPLLSEGLRSALNLPDDEQRLARDGYALTAMLACRSGVQLIAGKRSADGDPLMPSRLLLQTDDSTLAQRITRFVKEDHSPRQAPSLLTPGKVDQFLIPRPMLPIEPINSLRVTAFRDYLACPYRFYLRHVLKLRTADDSLRELRAVDFGNLAHHTLRCLADETMREVDDAQAIREVLSHSLDRAFQTTYGKHPPVAARIQAEQLRYRLDQFALVQADLVQQGWRIVHAEKPFERTILVDDQPFTITGTIDRIDHHPEHGYRLIDYKTTNTATHPDKAHRKKVDGEPTWVDLQLPLYIDLSESIHKGAKVETGYIQLPKKTIDVKFEPAVWDADVLATAAEQRDAVIRLVRTGVFWKPSDTNAFDGFAAVCGDNVADRDALINASARMMPPDGDADHDGGAA